MKISHEFGVRHKVILDLERKLYDTSETTSDFAPLIEYCEKYPATEITVLNLRLNNNTTVTIMPCVANIHINDYDTVWILDYLAFEWLLSINKSTGVATWVRKYDSDDFQINSTTGSLELKTT